MKYSVLVKTVVNVRIDDIEAESQTEAITRATTSNFHPLFFNDNSPVLSRQAGLLANPDQTFPSVRYTEYGEEDACYLVDETDDEEFEHSVWYCKDGITPMDRKITVTGSAIYSGRCPECSRATNPRILITVEGGIVQDVTSDVPLKVVRVDFDSEGADETELTTVNGDEAFVSAFESTVDSSCIDSIVNQVEAEWGKKV